MQLVFPQNLTAVFAEHLMTILYMYSVVACNGFCKVSVTTMLLPTTQGAKSRQVPLRQDPS
ncbi:MAG: hypothetical protein CMQ44_08315 [Gammaproteobacteria bacterium]|nr:hypothetical protein [Gammaproteobacteria bacterium]